MICENNEHEWIKQYRYGRSNAQHCRKCKIDRYGRIHARRLEKLMLKLATGYKDLWRKYDELRG